jgi:hypothetical protein
VNESQRDIMADTNDSMNEVTTAAASGGGESANAETITKTEASEEPPPPAAAAPAASAVESETKEDTGALVDGGNNTGAPLEAQVEYPASRDEADKSTERASEEVPASFPEKVRV